MRRLPRLTYANVVSSLALFVALGGVSYAAVKLPRNSVGAAQIKSNAVSGGKVKDGSLTDRDLAPGTVLQGVTGMPGPRGPAGVNGTNGTNGAKGEPGEPGQQGIQGPQGPGGGSDFFSASAADSNQTTNGGHIGIALGTEIYDTGSDFEPSTSTYTAPSAGIYVFTARVGFDLSVSSARAFVRLVSGGSEICRGTDIQHQTSFNGAAVSCMVKLDAGAAVSLELYTTANDETIRGGNSFETYLAGYRAGG